MIRTLLKKLQEELKNDSNTKIVFFDWMSVSNIDEFLARLLRCFCD
jgi:hypothetical protein